MMLLFTLALAIGASVWYYTERSTSTFLIAVCMYAALGVVVVKSVLIFLVLVAVGLYVYFNKPELIEEAKRFVDERIL